MSDILVVEDDFSTRNNILELLKESGYNVFGAEDGLKAFTLAKNMLPDLIISDIMMPGLDGIELLNELSKEPLTEAIPFVFLTARSEPYDVRLGMDFGADDYITKPFKAMELLKVVEVRLKKRDVRDAKMKILTDSISLSLPHELRTPLVAILGYSQLLKDQYNTINENDILQMSERIQYAGNRLNTTIQKFLIYSEIAQTLMDRDQLKAIRKLHCASVIGIIKSAAGKFMESYSRQNDIIYDLSDAALQINETYLEYIVNELIDNACKFSDPGSKVRVSGYSNKGYYELEISDNGRGMTEEQISNVGACFQFEKDYFQQSGNGLGLAIVKGLAEVQDGRVKIESSKDHYTTVRVSIPLSNKPGSNEEIN